MSKKKGDKPKKRAPLKMDFDDVQQSGVNKMMRDREKRQAAERAEKAAKKAP